VSSDAPRADKYTGSVYVSTPPSHVRASRPSSTRALKPSLSAARPCPHASPPSDPQPMAAEPAADDHDPRPPLADGAAAAGGGDASSSSASAAAEALMNAASEQLTLVYQGDVYIFDPVPPQKVAPLLHPCKFHRPLRNPLSFPICCVDLLRSSLIVLAGD